MYAYYGYFPPNNRKGDNAKFWKTDMGAIGYEKRLSTMLRMEFCLTLRHVFERRAFSLFYCCRNLLKPTMAKMSGFLQDLSSGSISRKSQILSSHGRIWFKSGNTLSPSQTLRISGAFFLSSKAPCCVQRPAQCVDSHVSGLECVQRPNLCVDSHVSGLECVQRPNLCVDSHVSGLECVQRPNLCADSHVSGLYR